MKNKGPAAKRGVNAEKLELSSLKKIVMSRDFNGRSKFKPQADASKNLQQILFLTKHAGSEIAAAKKVAEAIQYIEKEFIQDRNPPPEHFMNTILDSLFWRIILTFPQKADYVKDLRKTGQTFLKINNSSGQITLFENIFEFHPSIGQIKSKDRRRREAVEVMNKLEETIGMNEDQWTELLAFEKLHRTHLKGRIPLDSANPFGPQMTIYDFSRDKTGKKKFKRIKK